MAFGTMIGYEVLPHRCGVQTVGSDVNTTFESYVREPACGGGYQGGCPTKGSANSRAVEAGNTRCSEREGVSKFARAGRDRTGRRGERALLPLLPGPGSSGGRGFQPGVRRIARG